MALTIPISVPDTLYDVVYQRIRDEENETGKKANKSAIVVDLIEKGLKYEEMIKKEEEQGESSAEEVREKEKQKAHL